MNLISYITYRGHTLDSLPYVLYNQFSHDFPTIKAFLEFKKNIIVNILEEDLFGDVFLLYFQMVLLGYWDEATIEEAVKELKYVYNCSL